jgi:hypothetical protein
LKEARTIVEAKAAVLVTGKHLSRDDIESVMSETIAILAGHRKLVKLHRRPIGICSKRFRQLILVGLRDEVQILWSPGDGSQSPVIKIELDGERFGVRPFETEFEEVA